jgi:hypothetical protein
MESSGVPGKINISQSTFELIKDFFVCNYRGKLPAKNKGDLDMYLVKGIKQGFSPELLSILNKNKLQYLDLAIQSAQCCQEKKRHSILTM